MLPGGLHRELYPRMLQKNNKYNLHVLILYINVIISYSFMTSGSPGEKRAEKRGVLGARIFFIATVIGLNHSMWSSVHAYYI